MNVAISSDSDTVIVNELGPVLVFALAFVFVMGGVMALAVAICGWGRVNFASIDFWRGIARIQCK